MGKINDNMNNITLECFFLCRFQHDFSMVSKKYIFLFYIFILGLRYKSETKKKGKKRIKINPSG